MIKKATLLILPLLFCPCLSATAETITIAVASNFIVTMDTLVNEFEAESGHEVQVSYGSSGRIYAQIINGAPFDMFFSADQEKPELLEENGQAVRGSRFSYAIGTLVLWSKNSSLNLNQGEILRQGNFNKLSMANPRLAPYGVAAVQVLAYLGVEDATRDKWVLGENIAQAYQFVETGNADLGFVALSQVMVSGSLKAGSVWFIPTEQYSPIRQDVVLLTRGQNKQAAVEFLDFLQSSQARSIIEDYGYRTE